MLDRSLLRPLLSAYVDGNMPLYELRGRFYSTDIVNKSAAEEDLYHVVSMHLAMYTVGSWSESTLKDAIAWHIARVDGVDVSPVVPMWDQQWLEITASGLAPWPIRNEECF